jgi:hypothetical protein
MGFAEIWDGLIEPIEIMDVDLVIDWFDGLRGSLPGLHRTMGYSHDHRSAGQAHQVAAFGFRLASICSKVRPSPSRFGPGVRIPVPP